LSPDPVSTGIGAPLTIDSSIAPSLGQVGLHRRFNRDRCLLDVGRWIGLEALQAVRAAEEPPDPCMVERAGSGGRIDDHPADGVHHRPGRVGRSAAPRWDSRLMMRAHRKTVRERSRRTLMTSKRATMVSRPTGARPTIGGYQPGSTGVNATGSTST